MVKRFFDIFIGIVLLILLLPVWFLAILIIIISDPGPIFFKQGRVGQNGKNFDILKFRTMYIDNGLSSATTLKNDSRIFNGGNFLRKFKIDEMPQILNVISGSMSLVGPRPTVAEDLAKMTSEQKRRLSVKPGVTGLAQISGNTSISWNKRIELDLHYIDHWSVWADLEIMSKTGLLVIFGRADTHPSSENEWDD